VAVVSRLFPVLPNPLVSSIRWHGYLEQVAAVLSIRSILTTAVTVKILLFYCCWVVIFIENGVAQREANPWAVLLECSFRLGTIPSDAHIRWISAELLKISCNGVVFQNSCLVWKRKKKSLLRNSTTGGMNRKLSSSNFHCGVISRRSKKWLDSCCCIIQLCRASITRRSAQSSRAIEGTAINN
jgi:hypothetical protein